MIAYIPLEKTVTDFQNLLKSSALSGEIDVSLMELIQQLRSEPIYNVDKVKEQVSYALSSDNPKTNCLTGDGSEKVVVTKEKLAEILNIITLGGINNEPSCS